MAAPVRSSCLRPCKQNLGVVFHRHVWKALTSRFNPSTRNLSASQIRHTVRVRFAPSPTGWLHLGGLRTALYNYLFAKSRNGSFLLRIEDTDQTRIVPETADHLQEILEWTGIVPDEGPKQGGDSGPYIQSERLQVYNDNVKTLLDNGWAYPCFCTARRLELMRREAAQRGEPSKYDNRCRHLSGDQIQKFLDQQTPFVIRLKLEPTPEPWEDLIKGPVAHDIYNIEGDPVLLKSDGFPTYHFANVVDDHYMGITHVLRGSEWLSSTPKHILLYKAFGWSPPLFGHLPLIVNPDGSKLSKRQGDINVQAMRDADHLPESVLGYVTSIGGGFAESTQGMSLADMCKTFDLSLVRQHTGRLDPLRLKEAATDNLHKRAYSDDPSLVKALTEGLRNHVLAAYKHSLTNDGLRDHIFSDDYLIDVIRWGLKDQRVTVLRDFVQPELSYLWKTPDTRQVLELLAMEANAESFLQACLVWLTEEWGLEEEEERCGDDDVSVEQVSEGVRSIITKENIQPKRFFHFMRKALTGDVQGPPVAEMIYVLGRKNVVLRLQTALQLITQQQKNM